MLRNRRRFSVRGEGSQQEPDQLSLPARFGLLENFGQARPGCALGDFQLLGGAAQVFAAGEQRGQFGFGFGEAEGGPQALRRQERLAFGIGDHDAHGGAHQGEQRRGTW